MLMSKSSLKQKVMVPSPALSNFFCPSGCGRIYTFILLQEDPPHGRQGTEIGMVGDDKGIDGFLSIFGFQSEAEKSCPHREIFKGKDYI